LRRNGLLVATLLAGYLLLTWVFLAVFSDVINQTFAQGALTIGLLWFLREILALGTAEAWRRGGTAEVWTGTETRKWKRRAWKLVHAVPFQGYDVDHVAIGPSGVLAIETKYGDTPWTNNKIGAALFARSLDQAHKSAMNIRSLLRSEGLVVEVRPVLVVWGAAGKDLPLGEVDGVLVLPSGKRKEWIDELPSTGSDLTEPQILQAITALDHFIERRDMHERRTNRWGVAGARSCR
jgi:hypothetical protein